MQAKDVIDGALEAAVPHDFELLVRDVFGAPDDRGHHVADARVQVHDKALDVLLSQYAFDPFSACANASCEALGA